MTMDEEHFTNTLKIYDEIHKSIMEEYKNLLEFAEKFRELMHKEKLLLPYHMNIIDELHINENGHSRILLKLLQFRNTEGEYDFLESLLRYIKGKNRFSQFSCIQIKRPLITQEEARIDLWVRDREGDYAIIFENKVYNAHDQEAQLSRYIDKTKAEPYNTNNIFVVYLSSDGQEPAEQSWGGYKKEFTDRYINLSFKDDILTWLKEEVLPNINDKDVYLDSAIKQYIDHLEGMYLLRTINKQMKMNLESIVTSHLKLDELDDTTAKIMKLQEKLEDIKTIETTIESLKQKLRPLVFKEWKQRVPKLFPSLDYGDYGDYVNIRFYLEGKPFFVLINEDPANQSQLYCEVRFEDRSKVMNTALMTLHDLLPEPKKEVDINVCIYKYCGYEGYNQVFDLFCQVVERCRKFASPE